MEPKLREMRIGDLRTKIAACQKEWSALAVKSSLPDLTIEERTEISRYKEATIGQCDYLHYMLGCYEYKCEG
jgi:hypothetical protein